MKFNPEEDPRGFLLFMVAAGLMVFQKPSPGAAASWKLAEEFIAETERRVGKIIP